MSHIPADRLTHLFYAFSTIEAGRCTVGAEAPANFAALAELKKAHPHLRTLISIGGWGAGGFSDAALTEASRHGTRPASAIDPASVAPGHARRRMATPAAPACPLARGATNASW